MVVVSHWCRDILSTRLFAYHLKIPFSRHTILGLGVYLSQSDKWARLLQHLMAKYNCKKFYRTDVWIELTKDLNKIGKNYGAMKFSIATVYLRSSISDTKHKLHSE